VDPGPLTQSPFVALTFIAAPALLTNASSVLALSTTNRMLRTRDTMSRLLAQFEANRLQEPAASLLIEQVNRVESQAGLLLGALHSIYLALGAFAGATLVTLIGAALVPFQGALWFDALAILGLVLGAMGVGCLIFGSIRLFQATRLSLINIREEAKQIRARYKKN
jgi:hypothetical protein